MKVCFMIPGFGDGGGQRQCIKLFHELNDRKDIDAHLIYFHEGVNSGRLRGDTKRTRIKTKSNYSPLNILKSYLTLNSLKPDILVTWLHSADVYGAILSAALPRICWIMTERDSDYPDDFRFRLRRYLGRRAGTIIANSRAGQAYWLDARARARIVIVPNIIDDIDGNAEAGARSNTIVSVGRLEVQKNPLMVVNAFCALSRRRPDLAFQVVGDGSLRAQMEELVHAENAGDQVRFTGFRQDAVSLLSRAKALVSLSHHEGSPNVVLEAVAVGTLVIASDIPEHRAILGEKYPFYVAEPLSADACADVVEEALACEDIAGTLQYARDRLSSMTAARVGDAYLEVFRDALARVSAHRNVGQ